jgi:hypothetical protein
MISKISIIVLAVLLAVSAGVKAECPLDHFIIGCNRDGIEDTADDNQLFVDCLQKYRHSGLTEYANWFYPLSESIFTGYRFRIGEPGFDAFQDANPSAAYTYDPNRALAGAPNVDYNIIVECIDMSVGLRAVHKDYPQFTIDAVGQSFSHSYIYSLRGDGHMHMSYQALDGENLHWITFILYDALDDGVQYEPSEPITIVFNVEPLAGDLAVNGVVNGADLMELGRYWLSTDAGRHNDYYERADVNRDGLVNFCDFAIMASNWGNSRAGVSGNLDSENFE